MGADRTALAVRYSPGDEVLVYHLTGGELAGAERAHVLGRANSRIYDYKVLVGLRERFVRESWMCPAEFLIEEMPDTPFD